MDECIMKKLLLLLFSLMLSFNSYGSSHLDFALSDFCYEQPNVQMRLEKVDEYYSEEVYYFPNQEVGITATSICVYKNAYGQYATKVNLKNGKKDGKSTWWYRNGQLDAIEYLKDGKLFGTSTSWYPNGQMKSQGNWPNGIQDGKYTTWFKNGQMWNEQHWKNGNLDGKSTLWRDNGNKVYELNYKNSRPVGKEIDWYENGQKQREINRNDDSEMTGKYTKWNEKGDITFECIYVDGKCIPIED